MKMKHYIFIILYYTEICIKHMWRYFRLTGKAFKNIKMLFFLQNISKATFLTNDPEL